MLKLKTKAVSACECMTHVLCCCKSWKLPTLHVASFSTQENKYPHKYFNAYSIVWLTHSSWSEKQNIFGGAQLHNFQCGKDQWNCKIINHYIVLALQQEFMVSYTPVLSECTTNQVVLVFEWTCCKFHWLVTSLEFNSVHCLGTACCFFWSAYPHTPPSPHASPLYSAAQQYLLV